MTLVQLDGTTTADYTSIGADIRILADATENGDGGDVIVWGDDTTLFAGTISARGGARRRFGPL